MPAGHPMAYYAAPKGVIKPPKKKMSDKRGVRSYKGRKM
jgi:hypothetical protein